MPRPFLVFCSLVLLAGLSACSSPSQLYLLPEQPVAEHLNAAARSVVIEIIDLPDYAKDSNVALLVDDGVMTTTRTGLWADSPERALTGLLASALDYSLSAQVAAAPWPFRTPADIRVEVKVVRLTGALGGELSFTGQYFLTSPAGGVLERAGRFAYQVPLEGQSINDLATAQSKAMGLLATELAQRISSTSRSQL